MYKYLFPFPYFVTVGIFVQLLTIPLPLLGLESAPSCCASCAYLRFPCLKRTMFWDRQLLQVLTYGFVKDSLQPHMSITAQNMCEFWEILKQGAYRSTKLGWELSYLVLSCVPMHQYRCLFIPGKSHLVKMLPKPCRQRCLPTGSTEVFTPRIHHILDLHFVFCSANLVCFSVIISKDPSLPLYKWLFCLVASVHSINVANMGCWVFGSEAY